MGEATDALYHGEHAIHLTYGNYEAIILPEIGANLVSFKDTVRGLSFIREPRLEDMEEFKTFPIRHGIPVLFPPNRIQDGRFQLGDVMYQFPINEESLNNHLHGFLHSAVWTVESVSSTETESSARLSVTIDENHAAYQSFPHRFQFTIEYRLTERGLSQSVDVQNLGTTPMPFMLGFHTAINAPFSPFSSEEDCVFTATIGQRWELNERMLPTGNYLPLSEAESRIPGGGINPFFAPMDNHYTAVPQDGRNYAIVTDLKERLRFVYEVDVKYGNWMIWNHGADGEFFCLEPQTCLVNAPNVEIAQSGLLMLSEGEHWTATCHFYIETL